MGARGGGFLATRFDVYEAACRDLVREHNPEHQPGGSTEAILRDAGLLCALHLLAGCTLSVLPRPDTLDLRELPPELMGLADAQTALRSKVFTQAAEPIHRSIAEFLAARAIAHRRGDCGAARAPRRRCRARSSRDPRWPRSSSAPDEPRGG